MRGVSTSARRAQRAPSVQAGPEPVISVRAVIAAAQLRRAQLVEAVHAIDRELAEAFARLAEDAAQPLPDAPSARSVRAQRLRKDNSAAPKWPRSRTCDEDVLKAITWGLQRPRQIWARLDWGESAIKAACNRLLAAGRIVRHGGTWTLHYSIAPPSVAALRPTPRPLIADGVEYEPVWTGVKGSPSLLGDRETRS